MIRTIIPGVVASLALALSACGASEAESTAKGADERTVTIEHAMGSTTIVGEPQRIVALDSSLADATLMLDKDLVGIATYRGYSSRGSAREHGGQQEEDDACAVYVYTESTGRVVSEHQQAAESSIGPATPPGVEVQARESRRRLCLGIAQGHAQWGAAGEDVSATARSCPSRRSAVVSSTSETSWASLSRRWVTVTMWIDVERVSTILLRRSGHP